MIYPNYLPAQNALDRARTSAQTGMRRAKAELHKMQTARRKSEQVAPALQVEVLQVEPNPVPVTAPVPEPEKPAPTIRTQSQPVPQASAEPSVAEVVDSRPIGHGPGSQKAA